MNKTDIEEIASRLSKNAGQLICDRGMSVFGYPDKLAEIIHPFITRAISAALQRDISPSAHIMRARAAARAERRCGCTSQNTDPNCRIHG
jgi:hypothetical protein